MKIYTKLGILFLIVFASFAIFSCSGEQSSAAVVNELRFGLVTEPVTLDPLSASNTADGRSILFNVFEGLVKPDSTGRLYPALAESFTIEENGLVYVFTLRPGVLFHDGTALTQSDVIYSINTARASNFPGLALVSDITARGNNQIVIRLSAIDPDFLPFLTVAIVKEDNPNRETNPIGTGPFIVESYNPQEALRLARNPNYWQSDLPLLDRVNIIFVANSDALITGLMGGNIEGAVLTGSMIRQLNTDEFDLLPWYSNTVQLLLLNNAQSPMDDLRVRQAVSYAIDIQGIIDTAFFGYGEPSGSPLIPALTYVYNESLRDPYPRNIDRARDLLAEAGYPNGLSLEIVVPSNYTMHVDTAQVIVNQLSPAGINASIRLVDWGTWLTEVRQDRNYAASIISLDARDISPRSFLGRYHSANSGNFMNFSNAEYDRLYDEVLTELNEARRVSLYRELQRVLSDNVASVYIQDILGFWAFAKDSFGGVLNYPLYINDFSTIYRRN